MQSTLSTLIEHFENPSLLSTNIIPWSCPVPVFGDLSRSTIATLGLNPSNREFVDSNGKELNGAQRRFHTLNSLGLNQWSEAEDMHIDLITETCCKYFNNNPYNAWFKSLDTLISGTNMSYYHNSKKACHLDLIPYATKCKWSDLPTKQRNSLLKIVADTLGHLLLESSICLLILNGNRVIETLQSVSEINFKKEEKPEWNLPRKSGFGVKGYAFTGTITKISGVNLKREIRILGFNHNIQSSFGVTTRVKESIKQWITVTVDKDI